MNLLAAGKRLRAWGFKPDPPLNETILLKGMSDRYIYVFLRTQNVITLSRDSPTFVIQFSSLYELEVAVVYQTLRELPR